MKEKLNCLSVAEKLEIIKKIKENNESRKEISKDFNCAVSTISRILKQETKLKDVAKINGNVLRKRFKKGHYENIDKAVSLWFNQMRLQDCCITGPMITEKAKQFAVSLGVENFEPNAGWLSRWKIKNNIKYYKTQGGKASADEPSAAYWIKHVLPEYIQNYDENDIFNADESALFYKALPSGTMSYQKEFPSGIKAQKNRLTLLFLCNLNGTEKQIFSIGKSKQPHCFRGKTIPIDYYSNNKAWMTIEIWKKS